MGARSLPQRLPISIITGFLGSGKTTLLSRLLKDPDTSRALVIVNEFGEVGLDHLLTETPADDIVLLENGCLCCTMQGDLVQTLYRVAARAGAESGFDRVLVETTGLADPTATLHTILFDPIVSASFVANGVITVVDAVNGEELLDDQVESIRQVTLADHIVITKSDLAKPDQIENLRCRLRTLNNIAELHFAVMGKISAGKLLDSSSAFTERWAQHPAEQLRTVHSHHGESDEVNGIKTFTLRLDSPIRPEGLTLWMNLMAAFLGTKLLRVKGLVNVAGAPTVVHAVRHLFHEPAILPEWPSHDHQTRVVFITQGLDRFEIERTFAALKFTSSGEQSAISPAQYSRFKQALGGFRQMSIARD